jgi:DNA-binding winged helix-turn-helix (wHTH) protein
MTLRVGPFSIDPARRLVLRGDAAVHLTPKAFDLLYVLAAEAPRVVSKRELHDRLWSGTFVSDASLAGLVKELRKALHTQDLDAPLIRTAHRVGYACDVATRETEGLTVQGHWHWLVFGRRRVRLQQTETVIGRDPQADVWLDMPSVSRRHARIMIDSAGVQLEDLGSKNGTTVGDTQVSTAVTLRDGDRVGFGSVVSVYRTSSAGGSTETRGRVPITVAE